MSEKYSAWSPYNYAINNPVMVIDPDGSDIQTYTGDDAVAVGKALQMNMSTGIETFGGNFFTGFDFLGFGKYDWARRKDGSIYWDKNANDQKSTRLGETYMGKFLRIGVDSYISKKLWDGPLFDVSGSKLQTDIWLFSEENDRGELTGMSTIIKSEIMTNQGGYKGVKINSMPDIELSKNFIDRRGAFIGFNTIVEKHTQVPEIERFGLNIQGCQSVNVAQRIDINYIGKNLNISFKTDVFPSASAGIIGAGGSFKLMQYDQPSYRETHSLFKNGVRKPYLYPRN